MYRYLSGCDILANSICDGDMSTCHVLEKGTWEPGRDKGRVSGKVSEVRIKESEASGAASVRLVGMGLLGRKSCQQVSFGDDHRRGAHGKIFG